MFDDKSHVSIEKYKRGSTNYSINMTLIDNIIKWFKAPKTLYGIAGMIVIIIVLALDFAYWAGAIEVGSFSTGETVEEENETVEWEEVLVYTFEQEDTILAPGFGQVSNSNTAKIYEFPVEENASKAEIITTHTGNAIRPDVDLYIYGPDGEQVGSSAGSNAEEGVQLDERDFERNGYGNYVAEVRNFSNIAITYKITIDVYYKIPANETSEPGE